MKLPMYSIRDVKTSFLSPTVDQNDVSATRNFVHALMSSGSIMTTHPRDFDLVKVAVFDTDTGIVSPVDHEVIYEGANYEQSRG